MDFDYLNAVNSALSIPDDAANNKVIDNDSCSMEDLSDVDSDSGGNQANPLCQKLGMISHTDFKKRNNLNNVDSINHSFQPSQEFIIRNEAH